MDRAAQVAGVPATDRVRPVARRLLDRACSTCGSWAPVDGEVGDPDPPGGSPSRPRSRRGVAQDFLEQDPATTVLTAADGDAGGIQAHAYVVDEETPAAVGTIDVNPGAEVVGVEDPEVPQNALDGRYGRGTAPFTAAPDQFGQELAFGVAWTGTADLTGGVVARSAGLAADVVDERLPDRFDDVDVYRIACMTLFGEALAHPDGAVAPTRPAPQGTPPGEPDEDAVIDEIPVDEGERGDGSSPTP